MFIHSVWLLCPFLSLNATLFIQLPWARQVVLLSMKTVFSYIDPGDLPERWQSLRHLAVLGDAVRLALLKRHGGVYVDVSVMCCSLAFLVLKAFHSLLFLGVFAIAVQTSFWDHANSGSFHLKQILGRSLDDWLTKSFKQQEMAAFYYKKFGRSDCMNHGEYVENWFLACSKGSELIGRWHHAFQQFWRGRIDAGHAGGLRNSEMFRHTDLSCMREDQMNYLTMHCCFKWLIDSDLQARELWQESSLLLPADKAIGWIDELESVRDDWSESTVIGHHAARWMLPVETFNDLIYFFKSQVL